LDYFLKTLIKAKKGRWGLDLKVGALLLEPPFQFGLEEFFGENLFGRQGIEGIFPQGLKGYYWAKP